MGGRRRFAAMRFALALVLCLVAGSVRADYASNAAYQIDVAPTGQYTVGTSWGHPVPRASLLFHGADNATADTTFNTIRSYDSSVDFKLTSRLPRSVAPFTCRALHQVAVATHEPFVGQAPPSVGFRTTWDLATVEDDFVAIQEIVIEGSDVSDSVVRITVCVTNRAPRIASLGIRFMWDIAVRTTDGPYFGLEPPTPPLEPFLAQEDESVDPTADLFQMSAAQSPSITPPPYRGIGTITRPALAHGPTAPEFVEYTSWAPVYDHCFDSPTTGRTVGGPAPADAAIVYYWGATPATAIQLAQGETFCATQYLFTYVDAMPDLCQVRAALVGGAACDVPSIRLDASASIAPECAGSLEYRFLDPAGTIARDWLADPFFDADVYGTWTVESRCDVKPTCLGHAEANVVLEREPVFTAAAAQDQADCGTGLLVSWDAATFASGSGMYHVYRSEVGCAEALASAPIATDIVATSWIDATALLGVTYHYAVVAEDDVPAQVCTTLGPRGGAATARCAGQATDVAAPWIPELICWGLRASHVADAVTLDWSAGRAFLAGEHAHVWKAVGSVAAGFSLASAEGLTATGLTDTDTASTRQFFDVRAANECEVESDDDEPPGIDPPAGINCP